MLYLRELTLRNYCAYSDYTFNFCKSDGTPYQFICFFGPNGVGKSTLLEAISMLTANWTGRPNYMIQESLRKYIKSKDYEPSYDGMKGFTYGEKDENCDAEYIKTSVKQKRDDLEGMLIRGVYVLDGKDYVIEITEKGFVRNDFAPLPPPGSEPEKALSYTNTGPWKKQHLLYRQRIAHFFNSDSDLSMSKFQLKVSQVESFERIISEVMRYKADCIAPSPIATQLHDKEYCTDFVITKKSGRVHFKRMSAGEKKISKSFSQLLNLMDDLANPHPGEPKLEGWPRVLLIDNVEMHVYWDRHIDFINCLKSIFNKQQIIATTHSGVLVPRFLKQENDSDTELYIDLEKINE